MQILIIVTREDISDEDDKDISDKDSTNKTVTNHIAVTLWEHIHDTQYRSSLETCLHL